GFDSVTVTPGRTAPDWSATVPPMPPTPWADAEVTKPSMHITTTAAIPKELLVCIIPLPKRPERGRTGNSARWAVRIHPIRRAADWNQGLSVLRQRVGRQPFQD